MCKVWVPAARKFLANILDGVCIEVPQKLFIPNQHAINAKNKVYSLDGIARAPLGAGFGVYGKVGVAYADRKFDSGLGSEHKTGLNLGVGVDYALTKNVSLRAEATRFNNMPDANGFNKKTDRLGVGLAYQF